MSKRRRSKSTRLTKRDVKKLKAIPLPELKYIDNSNGTTLQAVPGAILMTNSQLEHVWFNTWPASGTGETQRCGDQTRMIKFKVKACMTMPNSYDHNFVTRIWLWESLAAGTTVVPTWDELVMVGPLATGQLVQNCMTSFRPTTTKPFRIIKDWIFMDEGRNIGYDSYQTDVDHTSTQSRVFTFAHDVVYKGDGRPQSYGASGYPDAGKFGLTIVTYCNNNSSISIANGADGCPQLTYQMRYVFRDN